MADNDDTILLLGQIDGKLDSLIDTTKGLISRVDTQEKRITALERWQSYIAGGAAVLGASAGEVWKWLAKS